LAQLAQLASNRQIKSMSNLIFFRLRQIKSAPNLKNFQLRQIKSAPNLKNFLLRQIKSAINLIFFWLRQMKSTRFFKIEYLIRRNFGADLIWRRAETIFLTRINFGAAGNFLNLAWI
jgi:hypothetical protein